MGFQKIFAIRTLPIDAHAHGGTLKTISKSTRRPTRRDARIRLQSKDQQELERLLKASAAATDPQTALEYVQRAVDLCPDDPEVQANVQGVVLDRLRRDAYVAFVAEADGHYVVTFRKSRPVVIPKSRARIDVYPRLQPSDGERTLDMLGWVLLGLIPAGLGAMLLSPLMASRALDVLIRHKGDSRDRRRAWVAIVLAGLLGCLGMVFSLVLAMHLVR